MSLHPRRFNLSALSAAVLAVTGTSVHAQDTAEATENENVNIEEVEVVGFRRALEKSIQDKKFATNIKDTINAEDIGKNTDQNIAEALGRVTGVNVVAGANGEGTQVTIRGAGANQTNVTLNGQQLTSTDFSQAVDLSSFSSDILSKLEVVKTPSADHDEGSLGGSVNLVTVRPLNLKKDVRSFTLQGRYNDLGEKTDRKIQGSFSETFLNDTLGVALTIYDETSFIRRDQYRVADFQASPTISHATDENGNVITDFRAIEQTGTRYELFQNTNDRRGASLGVQFAPSDATEFMLDVTYSEQEQKNVMDAIYTRRTGQTSFVEGVAPITDRDAAPFSDPQADWFQYDSETQTMTRNVARFYAGDLERRDGGTESTNLSIRLEGKHDFTDSFRMSAAIGLSESESESLPNAFTTMQNWTQVAGALLFDAGENIQPVGYDCTSGSCQIVAGSSFIDLGENIQDFYDDNGALQPGWSDNTALTGFNPADTDTFHLGFISERDVSVEDKLQNFQIDFDYDLDFAGLTTVEFGGKVSSRTKKVDNQNYRFTTLAGTEVIFSENGTPLAVPNGPLTGIRAPMIASDGIGYSNFMEGLGYGLYDAEGNEIPLQWNPIDVHAAKELIIGQEDVERAVDLSQTREADIDTSAFYLKTNFAFFDGRLTGDVGVRYVKTDVESNSYAGASFWEDNNTTLNRDFDLVKLSELRDTSLPACQAAVYTDPANPLGYEQRYQRVDGLGWDTSAGPDPSTWTRIEDQGPCHDPTYAQWAEDMQTTGESDLVVNWYTMWRYADVSTSRVYGWDSGVEWDGSNPEALSTLSHPFVSTENNSLQAIPTHDTHSYTNVLPNLNLNYTITDDLIGRFAIYKTMARPKIDSLRSGYTVTEQAYWGTGNNNVGSVDMYNTKLDPLTSNNLDLSLEWYFNDSSYVSLALFRKDQKNFETIDSGTSYITDVRNVEGGLSPSELLIAHTGDEADESHLEGCMPLRATADYGWWTTDPERFNDSLTHLCAEMAVSSTINGAGATIEGVELGYSQTYDFLPGIFGGLGVSANYTYQESEYEAEESTIDAGVIVEGLPVAETPKHVYNATVFWADGGHQVRLSYQGRTDSLVGTDWDTGQNGRTWNQGTIWNEGRGSLDLSASYEINENTSISLQAINLTDELYRQYFTSRTLEVERVAKADGSGYEYVDYLEGNPLEGDAPTSRTYKEYQVGTTWRLGIRVNF